MREALEVQEGQSDVWRVEYLRVEVTVRVTEVELKMSWVCKSSTVEAVIAKKVLVTELEVKTDWVCLLRFNFSTEYVILARRSDEIIIYVPVR